MSTGLPDTTLLQQSRAYELGSTADAHPVEVPYVLPVNVEWTNARRTASAKIRDGAIVVSLSKQWPKHDKERVIEELRLKVQNQFDKDAQIVRQYEPDKLLTIATPGELRGFVDVLNRTTLNVPLRHVRIGNSKYSRLAQMNIKTRTLTVSSFCLKRVPSSALRYLMLHELAHLRHADHSPAFWNLVGQFVPDYRRQDKIMQSFHRIRLFENDLRETDKPKRDTKLPPLRSKVHATPTITDELRQHPADIVAEPKKPFWGGFQLKLPF